MNGLFIGVLATTGVFCGVLLLISIGLHEPTEGYEPDMSSALGAFAFLGFALVGFVGVGALIFQVLR